MLDPLSLRRCLEGHLPGALDALRAMVEINSYTGNKEGVNALGRLTARTFETLGFIPELVPSTNPAWGDHLVMTRPGRGNGSVAMVSHLDTVFPPEEEERNDFHWLPDGDRIFGPGTHDIKGGTIMMWLVLQALSELAPPVFEDIHWHLLWNSSEETYSPDFGKLCRQRFDAQTLAALVFEAEGRLGEDRLLVRSRKGRATWRVTVEGRGAHAGSRHAHGVNAVVQLASLIQRIAGFTNYAREVTFNVAMVSGGAVLNTTPSVAVAEGEFRAMDPAAYSAAKASLLGLAGPGDVASKQDGHRARVRVQILSESPPWPRNVGTERLLEIWQETGLDLGQRVSGMERGGLSDGNFLWDSVPTLDGLGPWGDNGHCSERSSDGSKVPEFVDVTSFVPKAALNVEAILRLHRAGVPTS